MRLSHDNSERLIAIPGWRAERLGQGSFGSDSAVLGFQRHGWFTPETRHWLARLARPLRADFVAKGVDGFREE